MKLVFQLSETGSGTQVSAAADLFGLTYINNYQVESCIAANPLQFDHKLSTDELFETELLRPLFNLAVKVVADELFALTGISSSSVEDLNKAIGHRFTTVDL